MVYASGTFMCHVECAVCLRYVYVPDPVCCVPQVCVCAMSSVLCASGMHMCHVECTMCLRYVYVACPVCYVPLVSFCTMSNGRVRLCQYRQLCLCVCVCVCVYVRMHGMSQKVHAKA